MGLENYHLLTTAVRNFSDRILSSLNAKLSGKTWSKLGCLYHAKISLYNTNC